MTSRAVWRLILGDGGAGGLNGAAGARNMAVDQALLASVQEGGPATLRLYCWNPPCLSLGRNQHAAGLYDLDRAAASGIDIVRRPTGGLAVLHDLELTYCVLAPVALLGGARAAYTSINRALVEGLSALGVPAGLAGGGPARRPLADAADPCFERPAAGEVVAAGRKLVGSAQRCERGALLQHGSILLDGTQSAVATLLAGASAGTDGDLDAPPGSTISASSGAVTLRELLGRDVQPDELIAPLLSGFARVFGIRLAPDTINRDERVRADGLEGHYRAASWTWRH